MEAAAHSPDHHEHHEMPTSGRALTGVAFSATLHCLTGCAIGEILGMAIGTALGFSNLATIALAVVLAFFFGYLLTSIPLLRAGLAFSSVVPIAFASDTVSIAIMEIVDNAIMLIVPGAMEAGINSLLFWGSLSVALVIAGAAALPVNRWLIARGKGHTAVHETGIHGGPPTRLVAAIAAVAAVFGTVVLAREAVSGGKPAQHGSGEHASRPMDATAEPAARVRGLAASANGLTLQLTADELSRGQNSDLRFRILDSSGQPVRTFEVEHEKRMHLIVARRDLTGFQHLHPELASDGTWSTPVTIAEPGRYRVFADFKHRGRNETLAADLVVDGPADHRPLSPPSGIARTGDGYEVAIDGEATTGHEAELRFTVRKGGEPITVEPYLGAGGHLVALREGDLAYLHVHPTGHAEDGEHASGPVAFATEFPSTARYRLFLQFKHEGRVHTAAFTREVRDGGSGSVPDTDRQPEGGHNGH